MKPTSPAHAPSRTAAWLCLIISIAILAYLPGLSGSFLFDDFPNIVTNSRVHATELSLESLSAAARAYEPGPYGRPLATIGFALDYYLGGGDPLTFKLHGLLIHILNACLVFALARVLLSARGLQSTDESRRILPAAALLATAWAIHPLQVSSVLYVVQRMETLSACFILLALLAYCRGRLDQLEGRSHGWGWLALSAALTVVGLLAKESAAITPLLALVLEACLFHWKAQSARTQQVLRALYVLGGALGLALLGVAFWHYGKPEEYAYREYSAWERLLTQARVLVLHLKQIVLPIPSTMPFYYDNYPHSAGLFQPWATAASVAILAAMTGLALWLRTRLPLAALGIFWFLAAHALTSGIIPLELVYEHRNYLALLGILLAIYVLASEWARKVTASPIIRAAPIAAIAGLFAITLIRSMTWGSPLLLAMDMTATNPGSPRASNDLATLYFSLAEGDPGSREWMLATQEFERGAALPGSSPLPEHGLILMNASVGLPASDAWWDGLTHKLQARQISPQEQMAVTGLLSERQKGFQIDDQRLSTAYRALVERGDLPAHVYCNIGDHALNRLGDTEFGKRMFLTCARKSGLDPRVTRRTAEILRAEGHHEVSMALLELQADR
ncbi:hypothetical protein [Luteimonas sp. MC1895]|uniref:hypothetical protein n=1 Tax=Luteimonas sp. MC1895 TaxID=2819513 RepID=UPI0018F060F8|nr:hypothetical protein [Luteimonas sp. MC1895]MBJ6980216.1 hypothetical protein [Luteimonas sp. MC1895]